MKATCSSETSVDFQETTQHYIPENKTLQSVILFKIVDFLWYFIVYMAASLQGMWICIKSAPNQAKLLRKHVKICFWRANNEQHSNIQHSSSFWGTNVEQLLLKICWMVRSLFHQEFVPWAYFHTDVLWRLWEDERQQCYEKGQNGNWFLYHNNVSAHSLLVQEFLARSHTRCCPPLSTPQI
jgi:hypothetical protein